MKTCSKLLLIGLSLFSLVGCGQIEDTNGIDDYSIQTISDERIAAGGSSYSAVGMVNTSKTLNSSTSGTFKCAKFSGIYTVNSFSTSSNQLKYTINLEVESGNCVVAIVANKEIIKKIDANTDTNFTLPYGSKQSLKVVGESAKFKLTYNVE